MNDWEQWSQKFFIITVVGFEHHYIPKLNQMNQKKDRNKYVNAERMDQNRRYKQKFDQHKLGM